MNHLMWLLAVCGSLLTWQVAFSEDVPSGQESEALPSNQQRDDRFDWTTKELQEKYQRVNASLLITSMKPGLYSGPTTGPGYYAGYDGPLIQINWIGEIGGEQIVTAIRQVPIGAILSVDQPMVYTESMKNRYIVYYRGPFGETEFFILIDAKQDGSTSASKRFVERLRIYLLSQE